MVDLKRDGWLNFIWRQNRPMGPNFRAEIIKMILNKWGWLGMGDKFIWLRG